MLLSAKAYNVRRLNLLDIRGHLLLSQRALAELAGVSTNSVGSAEKKEGIRMLTAYAILHAINAKRAEQAMEPLTVDEIDWIIIDRPDSEQGEER